MSRFVNLSPEERAKLKARGRRPKAPEPKSGHAPADPVMTMQCPLCSRKNRWKLSAVKSGASLECHCGATFCAKRGLTPWAPPTATG